MIDELNLRYQVPRVLAQAWVEAEQVLPLLDGLDEVALEQREACVEAINEFRQAHWLLDMVVCSRSADYAALTTQLRLQGIEGPQPDWLTRSTQRRQYVLGVALLVGLLSGTIDFVGFLLFAVRAAAAHYSLLSGLIQGLFLGPLPISVFDCCSSTSHGSLSSETPRCRPRA